MSMLCPRFPRLLFRVGEKLTGKQHFVHLGLTFLCKLLTWMNVGPRGASILGEEGSEATKKHSLQLLAAAL